jgi:hypothetical protein
MQYDAERSCMACSFCGATRPVGEAGEGQTIAQYDLESGLAASAERGYGISVRRVACQQCGAVVSYGENETARNCDFCGSAQVVEQSSSQKPIRPEAVVPFHIDRKAASAAFARWLGSLWFRPSDLKRLAAVAEMTGMYVPYWCFDAAVHSDWTAQAGYYYYETEIYKARNEQGQIVERERQVQRVRWVPAWGSRDDAYDDLLVCASRGLPPELSARLEPFETRELHRYTPEFLAGWRAEEYSVELNAGWRSAVSRMEQSQSSRCSSDVPGDTQRFLNVTNHFSDEKFKHILLPVWISAYRYQGQPFQFLVNGQTGEVTGRAPWSVPKIALAVLAVLVVVLLIYSSQAHR